MEGKDGLYTTKHFIFGSYIKEVLLELKHCGGDGNIVRSKKSVLRSGSFGSPSYLVPVPMEDRDG